GVVVHVSGGLQLSADPPCGLCTPDLVASLSHPPPYVRVTAALALADRFSWVAADSAARKAGLDSLAARMHDRDAATRGAAARALLARRGAAALREVEPLLADSSVYTRAAVLQGLELPRRAVAAPLLLRRLESRATLLERMTAAEALGNLGGATPPPRCAPASPTRRCCSWRRALRRSSRSATARACMRWRAPMPRARGTRT